MPNTFGSTGCLLVLDFVDDSAEVAKSPDNEIPKTDKCRRKWEASFVMGDLCALETMTLGQTKRFFWFTYLYGLISSSRCNHGCSRHEASESAPMLYYMDHDNVFFFFFDFHDY